MGHATSPGPVIVIGSGITGLLISLELAEHGMAVELVSKGPLSECNTRYAQGGMAVALGVGDSAEAHRLDTLAAGAGLCDDEAVAVLTREAPARYADLVARGVAFDQEAGQVALTLEGAHSHRRVVHARGDATGAEIERALAAQVRAHPRIQVREHAFVWDLMLEEGRCVGATLVIDGAVQREPAAAVVLAAGGLGRVFSHTTNPPVATGDGVAMAWRAGAAVRDLEFVQFHPTAMRLKDGGTFLISEAVRGEGAILRDASGAAFMAGRHPLGDLAPRDVVARAIAERMAADGRDHVWLDLSHLDAALVARRFPTIRQVCEANGVRLPMDPIPVAPAAHYACGGVVTDLHGRTSLPGLYAAGEVAWTGVHGANRLASNSLLECVVFGHRLAATVRAEVTTSAADATEAGAAVAGPLPAALAAIRLALPSLTWRLVGLLRDEAGLAEAIARIETWRNELTAAESAGPGVAIGELRNLLDAAWLIATAARWRHESRGCHYRLDYPEVNPAWQMHHTQTRSTTSRFPSTLS